MQQDPPSTRLFTVNVAGTVHRLSVDCRTTHTLRDVLLLAMPSPPPPLLSLHSSTAAATARRCGDQWWIESSVCVFAGQRMALSTPSEWAPAELSVSWDVQSAVPGGATGSSHRRRQRHCAMQGIGTGGYSGGDEQSTLDSNDEEDDESVDSSSSSTSSSRSKGNDGGGRRVSQRFQRSYLPGLNDSEDENRNSENNIGNDTANSCSGYEEDSEDSGDGSGIESDAVLPIVVGGVVRLINTESREKSHQWTVYIRGLFNETDYLTEFIESVHFILDPSFTPSERRVTTAPFELTEVGWGEFVVKMRVQLRHYPRPLRMAFKSGKGHAEVNPIDAASLFSASASVPLAGFARGPTLSPVVDLLSRRLSSPLPVATAVKRRRVESVKKEEEEEEKKKNGSYEAKPDTKPLAQSDVAGTVWTETQCPGVVTLSHLLRFSHRPRRGHCIPPLGRPYEPDEHIGYVLVQTPVVTEQYDEIVIPDAPAALCEATAALPDLFRHRIAIVKSAAAQQRNNNNNNNNNNSSNGSGDTGDTSGSGAGGAPTRDAAFCEKGVSCWPCIAPEEPDDAALAESFLDSVGIPLVPPQLAEATEAPRGAGATDPAALLALRPGRGRRKLTGAEIDLAALRNARQGLVEGIEKMRGELAARQSAHIFQHYT